MPLRYRVEPLQLGSGWVAKFITEYTVDGDETPSHQTASHDTMELPTPNAAELHGYKLLVAKLAALGGKQIPTQPAITGEKAIDRMINEFVTLVAAYNKIGAHQSALDAQALVIALATFNDTHVLEYTAWPARVVDHDIDGVPSLAEPDEEAKP